MFKQFVTLIRGRGGDVADALSDANALTILRQQLRDCALSVEAARRSVAMVMAYAERERQVGARIVVQLADLEARAMDALAKGCDDLATSKVINIILTSAKNCSFPLTYEGELYYSCIQNVTNITQCDQHACLVANRKWAICSTSTGTDYTICNTGNIHNNYYSFLLLCRSYLKI